MYGREIRLTLNIILKKYFEKAIEKYWKNSGKDLKRISGKELKRTQQENATAERAAGQDIRTREEIGKEHQVTALRFQSRGLHQTSQASFRGKRWLIKGGERRGGRGGRGGEEEKADEEEEEDDDFGGGGGGGGGGDGDDDDDDDDERGDVGDELAAVTSWFLFLLCVGEQLLYNTEGQVDTDRVCACLPVTCHLSLWHNDRGLYVLLQ